MPARWDPVIGAVGTAHFEVKTRERTVETDRKIAMLRTHEQNIERYQGLLRTNLNEVETRFIERRLSEERFAMAMLRFMGREDASARSGDHGGGGL